MGPGTQQLVPQLQQLPALVGDDHAGGRPLKDGDMQLLLQSVYQIADAGLGDVQLLGRLAERPAPLYHGYIYQLLPWQTKSIFIIYSNSLKYQIILSYARFTALSDISTTEA